MSTFDGNVAEFPDIRIDYFRHSDPQSRPPLACFLSHVHSDHLAGLESCKSPFIYCSPATRDIVLRLEKYPHRMNFAKGILETRSQTYRHLKNLLKAIPLETPTVIELAPGNQIRVTLFDANHCVGAVMFLIEGHGKAVLYSGDIRSETWWVNALMRHPVLLPYAWLSDSKPSKRLDTVYLDTTFVASGREDAYHGFPSKADGINELLQKVAQYPKDTMFYFDAWTFGYEDVWQALSTFLGSQIHVDDYRYGLYRALVNGTEPKAPEAVKLMGFHCGNHFQQGCLTSSQCRIHSCEKGTGCEIWNKDFVRITPIISRHNGNELAELGAGGGQGDLNQQHELEVGDTGIVGQLMALCATKLQGQPQLLSNVLQMLSDTIKDRVQFIALDDFNLTMNGEKMATDGDAATDMDDLALEKLIPALARVVTKAKQKMLHAGDQSKLRPTAELPKRPDGLPKYITFPYSRHSSFTELCFLVKAFKPNNIHPCTVDEKGWSPACSMNFLFGQMYGSPPLFPHDQLMLKKHSSSGTGNSQQAKPGSFGSDSDKYATPTRKKPADHHNGPQVRQNRVARRTSEPAAVSSRRRGRPSRPLQNDNWPPPRERDHYSPCSKSSDVEASTAMTAPTQFRSKKRDLPLWQPLTRIETTPKSPVQDLWLKRIGESNSSEQKDDEYRVTKKRRQSHSSLEYGRLTPPQIPDSDSDIQQKPKRGEIRSRRLQSEHKCFVDGKPLSGHSSESTPRRMAFRREAFNAAIGSGGHSWSDISLVSVNGHQVKEEEL